MPLCEWMYNSQSPVVSDIKQRLQSDGQTQVSDKAATITSLPFGTWSKISIELVDFLLYNISILIGSFLRTLPLLHIFLESSHPLASHRWNQVDQKLCTFKYLEEYSQLVLMCVQIERRINLQILWKLIITLLV